MIRLITQGEICMMTTRPVRTLIWVKRRRPRPSVLSDLAANLIGVVTTLATADGSRAA
jgi:ABC-type uncharacterized transport system permease subunit